MEERPYFLTMVEFGEGSVLMYIRADSREQLNHRYPELQILDALPPWLSAKQRDEVWEKRIELEDPDPFLQHLDALREGRDPNAS